MTQFEQGHKHFLDGKFITGKHGTFKIQFLNGWHNAERSTKCNFTNRHWSKDGNVKSL